MEKSKKHEYVFSYTTKKDKQLWGFKYPYYNNLNQRKFKEKRQFTSEKLAFRALLEFQLLIEKEQLIFADNYDITVKQWSEKWYNDNLNDWAKSTQATHKNIVFNHIIPRLGKFNLRKLSRSVYKKEFVDALLKEHAEVTVQRWHATFMSIVNAAVLDDVLDKNRFKQIVFNVQQTDRFFNNDELLKFLTYLDTVNFDSFEFRYKVLFTTFLYSGMRKGEALGLTWNDINFKEKHITVNKSRDRHGMKPPKTKTSYRTIDVDDTLIDLLRRYKIYEKANCLKKGIKLKESDIVFLSSKCVPISISYPVNAFNKIIDKLELPRITLHGLRHTHATMMLASDEDCDIKYLSERLGHKDVTTTMNIYVHTLPEKRKETAHIFSNVVTKLRTVGSAV